MTAMFLGNTLNHGCQMPGPWSQHGAHNGSSESDCLGKRMYYHLLELAVYSFHLETCFLCAFISLG